MKISESWLRTWCSPDVDTDALAAQLTLLGLEVDRVVSTRPTFEQVVVARIETIEQHPDADRLRVCTVDVGDGQPLQVVCGAPNARQGLVTALARVGGRLPDGTKLKKAKLRGVASQGMLCSGSELQLSEESDGILELAEEAVPGTTLEAYLELDDAVIEIELTPDRGDCLSVRGVARELSAKYGIALQDPFGPVSVPVESAGAQPVHVEADNACVRYAGRVIEGVDLTRPVPLWMSERLRRSGLRCINPAVDVTNYVLLERGHPMHAFDLDRLSGAIRVRHADAGESLELLDGRTVALDDTTTVIADDSGAIGLAGIMGGDSTAVSDATTRIFFECALFLPSGIAGRPRRYATQTDASHRFERGVDPAGQRDVLEYASRLLIDIAGGRAGPIEDWQDTARLPRRDAVTMRRSRLDRVLGAHVDDAEVMAILQGLGIGVTLAPSAWSCIPPSHRYDLSIEEDFIEEIGRVHGYENLARRMPLHRPTLSAASETRVPSILIKRRLATLGYQEAVTLSFVDAESQSTLRADLDALALANPISEDLGVMRTTLVVGLLEVLKRNRSRQIGSMRLFETGLRFLPGGDGADTAIDPRFGDDLQIDRTLRQQSMIAGLLTGRRQRENWNATGAEIDFFDVKRDLDTLFALANGSAPTYTTGTLPLLDPGRQAALHVDGVPVGYIGAISPRLERDLDLGGTVWVFELALAALERSRLPSATALSRYPRVRRDLAVILDDEVAHARLLKTVRAAAPETLEEVVTFDLYRGESVGRGRKSLGIGLILRDVSRTLADKDADAAVAAVVRALQQELGAELRG